MMIPFPDQFVESKPWESALWISFHGFSKKRLMKRTELDFKKIFKCSPGLYLLLLPDLTIAGASDAYLEATLTERDVIIGKNLFDVFPDNPDDTSANGVNNLRYSLNYVLKYKTAHTMAVQRYDIQRADGVFEKKFWSPVNKPVLDDERNVLYIIHRVEDVTAYLASNDNRDDRYQQEMYQRVQEIQGLNQKLIAEIEERAIAEEKLKEAQILLQSTIESHKDILIFSIDREFRYLNFNKAFMDATFRAYGTRVDRGVNMLDGITSSEEARKIQENCLRAISGESHTTVESYGNLQRSHFETRYNPVVSENGEIIGVTVLSANVTDRINAEEKIRALNKELEAFSYSVAHDLRAPVRIMDGYAALINEDYGQFLDEEGVRLIEVIRSNARHMGALIDDLLDFSKLGRVSVNTRPVNIDALVRSVVDEQLTLTTNNKIVVDIGKLLPTSCDGSLIRHVFSNLVSNAIKYSRKKERPIVEIGSENSMDGITYFVRDNGAGFDPRYSEKLFNVFQRLHKVEEYEGTGVGLAIAHRIVSKHGGRIWAESEVGNGATFYLTLPSIAVHATQPSESELR
jgi:signal transduction histidine kinase